jgi:hypothetical protein
VTLDLKIGKLQLENNKITFKPIHLIDLKPHSINPADLVAKIEKEA